MTADDAELVVPPESKLLRAAYESSGLAVSAMAEATGISKPSIHIAMNGFRYKQGQPVAVSPPDKTLVKLASLLRVQPAALREAGRERAAQLLEEIPTDQRPTTVAADIDSRSRAEGRRVVTQQVLGVFSTEELRAEIQRREAKLAEDELYADEDEDNEAFHRELAEDLRTEQWPG
ncbi:MAG: hypothetical protein ACTH2M_00185 [Microbacteriaceae bacterium]